MLPSDIGIVRAAMTALNAPQDLIDQIVDLLDTNSEDLGGHVVTKPAQGWFGGSDTGHRIAVNSTMAHQAVEEEFQKLADSLRTYSGAIRTWAEEVQDVDVASHGDLQSREQVIEQVNTQIIDARDRSADSEIGDGTYTVPSTVGGA